VLHLKKLTTST